MRTPSALALSLLVLAPFTAQGMTLDDLAPGKTVFGTALTVNEMKGKIVFVEYWGTH